MDTAQILTKVLTIIDYQDNKEQFIDLFLSQCIRLAIIAAIDSLTADKKNTLLKQIDTKSKVEEIRVILKRYITESFYQTCLMQTSQKQFIDYIETILPTLNPAKKEELMHFLAEIAQKQK